MSSKQFSDSLHENKSEFRVGERISIDKLKEIKSGEVKKNSKKSKYGSKKTVVDGIVFDSSLEAKRYSQLKLWERAKIITNLRLQVPYDLIVNGIMIAKYIADFVYEKDGVEVTEDSKGFLTTEYRLKKKLMKAIHNIDIFESKSHSDDK